MRKLRILTALTGPDGVVAAGSEIVVEEAEARILLGAIGLAVDLGEVKAKDAKTATKTA